MELYNLWAHNLTMRIRYWYVYWRGTHTRMTHLYLKWLEVRGPPEVSGSNYRPWVEYPGSGFTSPSTRVPRTKKSQCQSKNLGQQSLWILQISPWTSQTHSTIRGVPSLSRRLRQTLVGVWGVSPRNGPRQGLPGKPRAELAPPLRVFWWYPA